MTTAISPKELRQAITDARAELQAALHSAHEKWEVQPPHGEGEDAWSPRQVAEHAVGAEIYFASAISQACGAPKLELQKPDVATPAAAAASLTRFSAVCDNILRHVSDADLAKTFEVGRMGETSVQRMMEILAHHARDHANQILTASK
jgi:hypothetical protein